MNVVEKLNRLSELRGEISKILTPLQSVVDDLLETISSQTAELREKELVLEGEIQQEVLSLGQTIRGEFLQAIYRKGAVTWDSSALKEYAVDHSEILALRKTGKPSVRIAEIKKGE